MLKVMFIAIGAASMSLAVVLWGYLLVQARREAFGALEARHTPEATAGAQRSVSMVASTACIAGHFFCLLALHVNA